jgi:hypothetical protein
MGLSSSHIPPPKVYEDNMDDSGKSNGENKRDVIVQSPPRCPTSRVSIEDMSNSEFMALRKLVNEHIVLCNETSTLIKGYSTTIGNLDNMKSVMSRMSFRLFEYVCMIWDESEKCLNKYKGNEIIERCIKNILMKRNERVSPITKMYMDKLFEIYRTMINLNCISLVKDKDISTDDIYMYTTYDKRRRQTIYFKLGQIKGSDIKVVYEDHERNDTMYGVYMHIKLPNNDTTVKLLDSLNYILMVHGITTRDYLLEDNTIQISMGVYKNRDTIGGSLPEMIYRTEEFTMDTNIYEMDVVLNVYKNMIDGKIISSLYLWNIYALMPQLSMMYYDNIIDQTIDGMYGIRY